MIWKRDADDERTAIIYMPFLHNPSTILEIARAIDEIESDGGIRNIIFSSHHEKNWCTGLDIPWIMEQYRSDNRASVKKFFLDGTMAIFRRMLTIPIATIAAITGHAWGNGVILALQCDIRYMRSDRGYFCLPEAELDLTDAFPPSAMTLIETRYDPFIKDVMIPTAKKVTAPELEEKKIIEKACSNSDDVMKSALSMARDISHDANLFRRIMDDRKRWASPVIDAIDTRDAGAYDYMIGRFWKLMERMNV